MNRFNLSHLIFVGLVVVAGVVFLLKNPSANPFKFSPNQGAVVTQVQELGRLETTSFTLETIIEAGTNDNLFKNLLFGDRLLLIAHGEVLAGIDLSKIEKDNIKITGKKVEISLPAPEVFVVKLDSEKTRVYDRQQGFLTKGDKDLEAAAREQAELGILVAACEADILDQAQESATTQLSALLMALGFDQVELEFASGSCG